MFSPSQCSLLSLPPAGQGWVTAQLNSYWLLHRKQSRHRHCKVSFCWWSCHRSWRRGTRNLNLNPFSKGWRICDRDTWSSRLHTQMWQWHWVEHGAGRMFQSSDPLSCSSTKSITIKSHASTKCARHGMLISEHYSHCYKTVRGILGFETGIGGGNTWQKKDERRHRHLESARNVMSCSSMRLKSQSTFFSIDICDNPNSIGGFECFIKGPRLMVMMQGIKEDDSLIA